MRGRKYTSLAFAEAVLEAGLAGSIGSVGDALKGRYIPSQTLRHLPAPPLMLLISPPH